MVPGEFASKVILRQHGALGDPGRDDAGHAVGCQRVVQLLQARVVRVVLAALRQAPACMRQSVDLEILVRPGDIGVRSVACAGLDAGEQSEDQDKHGRSGGHHADRDAEAGVGLLEMRAGASDRSAGGVRGGIIGGEILPCGGRVGRSPAALGQNGQNAVNGRLIQRRAVQVAAQKRLKMFG